MYAYYTFVYVLQCKCVIVYRLKIHTHRNFHVECGWLCCALSRYTIDIHWEKTSYQFRMKVLQKCLFETELIYAKIPCEMAFHMNPSINV